MSAPFLWLYTIIHAFFQKPMKQNGLPSHVVRSVWQWACLERQHTIVIGSGWHEADAGLPHAAAGPAIRKRLSASHGIAGPHFAKARGKASIDGPPGCGTTGYVACRLCLFAAGPLLITLTAGCGLKESMLEFASALGTAGLSIGITGPLTDGEMLLVEMIGMLFGRLEVLSFPRASDPAGAFCAKSSTEAEKRTY